MPEIMYPVNYLLSLIQNRNRDALFENQTSLFEVIDQTNGVTLDTTVDCIFLSYFSGLSGDFSINGNNQINLTPEEVIIYIGARMYYYNPNILDSIIFGNYTPVHWLDCNDPRTIIGFDSAVKPNLILSKNNGGTVLNSFTPATSSDVCNYAFRVLNNFLFGNLWNQDPAISWFCSNPTTTNPISMQDAFSLAVVFEPSGINNYGVVFTFCRGSSVLAIQLQLYMDASNVYAKLLIRDGVNTNQAITKSRALPTKTPFRFILSYTYTSIDFYFEDDDPQNEIPTTINDISFTTKNLFDRPAGDGSFYGWLNELIVFDGAMSQEYAEKLMLYFKTKYYIT